MNPSAGAVNAPEYDHSLVKVMPKIKLKAEPFSLANVRLLDGPFKHAQDLDHRYLLSLDADRLLRNFRVNAGIPTTAEALGGWEAPDCELRGHFVGHYLSACSKMYASTGDVELKNRVVTIVSGLAQCQEALHNGYLSAFPESFIDRVEKQERVWAPWYTLHKIYAGLEDAYLYCGDEQALDVARKMAAWAKGRMDKLTDEQMQGMLNNEHGGMNETLANLYAITGDRADLALSERFDHQAVLGPLSRRDDPLNGLHANTQIPKVIGAARQYELTADPKFRTIATYFWDVVVHERSYVIGGNSDGEHFTPKDHLSEALSNNTTETCNTYNMLKLTRHLFEWDPKAEYADYYERALYNHILASQNPETGMMCYYVPLRPGSHKTFSTPTDSFWCCVGTGVENHSQYGNSIYFHGGDHGLYVNLFIASELRWPEKDLVLRQETRFPDAETTRLTFTCKHPTRLALHLRHPGWAGDGFQVLVNGKPEGASAPQSFVEITRTWKSGDTVEVHLPMALHTEGFRDNPKRLAFLDGPIVLCGAVESHAEVPDIVAEGPAALANVRPVTGAPLDFQGEPAAFRTAAHPDGVTVQFKPFFATYQGSYTVYWDELTPQQWRAKQEQQRQEMARQADLDSRTVDRVQPGNRASEAEHQMAGEQTFSGDFGDRRWRDARDSGWFSYNLKITAGVPQDLLCTYWGGDRGRAFQVLVNGQKLADVTIAGDRRDKFIEQTYSLPADVLAGHDTITVRFQAPKGGMAGGVFDCRVLRH